MTDREREAIFRRWLDIHLGLMWKVVRAFTVTQQDQEDLLQQVLLELWTSLPAFRGEAKESTWIYRVSFNTALAWRRDEKRRRVKHEAFLKLNIAPEVASDPHEKSQEEEMVEMLYTAIRQLP